MFEILWTVIACGGPLDEPSAAPALRPVAAVSAPPPACAACGTWLPDADVVSTCLLAWERASQHAADRVPAQCEELRLRIRDELNEHAAVAVEELLGAVRASRLTANFDWRVIARVNQRVCLEAIPKDQMERLFYSAIQIELQSDEGVLERIVVVGRNQLARTVWRTTAPPSEVPAIQLVRFENGIPPSPARFVRTAAAVAEPPQ